MWSVYKPQENLIWLKIVSVRDSNLDILCVQPWPNIFGEWQIYIHKICCLRFCDGNLHLLQNVIEWLDELQSITKYLFAMKINLWQNSRKETLPLHCSPAREVPAGMSVILFNSDVSVDEDKTGDHAFTLIQLSCPYT